MYVSMQIIEFLPIVWNRELVVKDVYFRNLVSFFKVVLNTVNYTIIINLSWLICFSPVVKRLSLLTLNQPSQVRTLAGENCFVLCLIGIDATTFWNYNISKHLPDNRNPPSFVSCLIGIDTTTFWNYNISKHPPDIRNPSSFCVVSNWHWHHHF